MLAIPAEAAGVRERVVVTPPNREGGLDPIIALAAELCGIDAVWTVGGAQAIAALAFGAGDIPRVDKICGPGNAWVAEAKTLVASLPGGPAIDMPAGPSELLVIADDSADAATVAADLLSQAEHDSSAQVLLATPSEDLARAVEAEVAKQVASLPRVEIARTSLASARILLTAGLDEAVEVSNLYAPEHLSLAVADPDALVPLVRNAGAIFAGHLAAETFGDYLAGSSHVLPTDGAARAWSGISVYSFLKALSVQSVTPQAAARIAGPAAALARLEGLEAHARAADARRESATPPVKETGSDAAPPLSLAHRLARPEVLALAPFDIAANANDAFGADAIKLDANENPYPPLSDGALAAGLNRYPEPQPARLKRAMAALYGVQPENLVVTRGADDAIDILVRAFCRGPEDAVSICTPTFSAYAHFARLQEHGCSKRTRCGLRLRRRRLPRRRGGRAVAQAGLHLFAEQPDRQSGRARPRASGRDALPETIASSTRPISNSPTRRARRGGDGAPNLVVLKTLSKAFGLAAPGSADWSARADLAAWPPALCRPTRCPACRSRRRCRPLAPSRRAVHEERIARIKADRERLAPRFASSPIVRT
jgi:histidinol dehydrogenase